jgi:hypothetical protein
MKKKTDESDRKTPIGLGLQTTSCGVGILITEIDAGSAASLSGVQPSPRPRGCQLSHDWV